MTQPIPGEGSLAFQAADTIAERVAVLEPRAYGPDRAGYADWIGAQETGSFDTIWLHDQLNTDGTDRLLDMLKSKGDVAMVSGNAVPLALRPATLSEGTLNISAIRTPGPPEAFER